LEAAPAGWSGEVDDPEVAWCGEGTYDSVLTGDGIGEGRENTRRIIEVCGVESAAGVAAGYTGGGLSDWFLPSVDELDALYEQRAVVGGLASDDFWSSSQDGDDVDSAWGQGFGGGLQDDYYKGNDLRVRPVRAF